MKRALVLAALGCAAAAVAAAPAGATNECRGFMVCVPVAGPWVAVPTARTVPAPTVEFQLSCPRGYVAGGLDAELTDRAIDLDFSGKVGAPVGPGTTTSGAVVFRGMYVGATARAPSFRPHVGCIPASGGGSRIPTSASAFRPGEPTIRRVRTVRLRPGTRSVARGCARGERLVAGAHAIGFYTRKPPAESLVSSVTASERIAGGRVVVSVRAGAAVGAVRAVVQVSAVCAGGS